MESLALGIAICAMGGAGLLAWALGKLSEPIGSQKTSAVIDALMRGPIAAYTYPPVSESDMTPHEETGNPDVDMRIALARQEEKVEGLKQTVEREFARMAEALGKHADAVNNAFAAMKNDHPTKAELGALADKVLKVERIVYGACGTILLGVLGALIALVVVKP